MSGLRDPVARAAYMKKWREANRAKCVALARRWQIANPTRAAAFKKKWRESHLEQNRAAVNAYWSRQCTTASDLYIRDLLTKRGSLKARDIPPQLIHIAREALLGHRLLKEIKNGSLNTNHRATPRVHGEHDDRTEGRGCEA